MRGPFIKIIYNDRSKVITNIFKSFEPPYVLNMLCNSKSSNFVLNT